MGTDPNMGDQQQRQPRTRKRCEEMMGALDRGGVVVGKEGDRVAGRGKGRASKAAIASCSGIQRPLLVRCQARTQGQGCIGGGGRGDVDSTHKVGGIHSDNSHEERFGALVLVTATRGVKCQRVGQISIPIWVHGLASSRILCDTEDSSSKPRTISSTSH